ncbi:hypothetical protein BG262_05830 [Floricoccus penangensis]|uniref:DUF443 family protein n=1 Tax=Floricoccus penangensis TaxID=1859475 RepID=A0A9Q5JF04_9LACT|nr:hypothetical protein [Floricoccus penangensis]OFI46003.1 hypothetical protein BG262_05830 [Floricoccus penangensis]
MGNEVDKFVIQSVKRINIRYYLFELHGRYYIADYSNPKDLRQYIAGMFQELQDYTTIYDVTGHEKEYNAKPLKWYEKSGNEKLIYLIAVTYLVNIVVFPAKLNLAILTYDPRIVESWKTIILLMGIGSLFIIVYLYFKKTYIDLEGNKEYLLVPSTNIPKKLSKFKRLLLYIVMIIFLILLLFIGIGSSSYSQLLFFGIIPVFPIPFSRFLNFVDINNTKYHIEKKEK